MTRYYLVDFLLAESWQKLLTILRFEPDVSGVWTDGWSQVRFARHERPIRAIIGFNVVSEPEFCKSPDRLPEVLQSPSGIQVTLNSASATERRDTMPRFCLNHVAFDVGNLQTEQRWFEGLLGTKSVLTRTRVWEPAYQGFLADCHIFQPPGYYLTLRDKSNRSQAHGINHVGWMAQDVDSVLEAAQIVRSLNWEIVLPPFEVDGSFLFHFRAEDGGIHDFFCPLDPLIKKVSLL